MNTRISPHATALALAAIVTLGTLAGLDRLAAHEQATAQAQFAQTTLAAPAPVAQPAS